MHIMHICQGGPKPQSVLIRADQVIQWAPCRVTHEPPGSEEVGCERKGNDRL